MEISIENLYKVFSRYNISENFKDRCCNCCITDKEIKLLLSKQVKNISEDDLGHFMRSAITTYGDENDYKHFLPRILELLKFNDNLIDDFLTFEKLNYTNWKSWNKKEIIVVESYFLSLWIDVLKSNSDNQYFENVFTLLLVYIETERVLIEWERQFSIHSVKVILDYVLNRVEFNITKENNEAFNNWLSSITVLELLENQYNNINDKSLAKEISIVYTILEKNGNRK
jgi:hypothetical protein